MGNVVITGHITCEPGDLNLLLAVLPEHIRQSRAEPGCLEFHIRQSAPGSCRFVVSERFVDRAAFDAHTARTRTSTWWARTRHFPRDLEITET